MGPVFISTIVAIAVSLSSDVTMSAITYKFMDRLKNKEHKPDPLRKLTRKGGDYAKHLGKS